MNDVSEAEGTSRIYRFACTVVLFAWYEKIKKLPANDWYDSFSLEVVTDDDNQDTGVMVQPHP